MPLYTDEQKTKALELFHDLKSYTKTVRILGYPTREHLARWVKKEGLPPKPRKRWEVVNTPEHPLQAPIEVKLSAIRRCFENGESVTSVAKDIRYTAASIYYWYQKYLKEGLMGLQKKRRPVKQGASGSPDDAKALAEKVHRLQLEVDILKETLNIIKKDPGVDLSSLKNREKTRIVNALRKHYGLDELLDAIGLARSVYYYNQKHMEDTAKKDRQVLAMLEPLFMKSRKTYGYRRLHSELKRSGKTVSEKVIQRVTKLGNLLVYRPKKKKYCSYKGEITPAVPNIINRDFHADAPNQKWLTDITEFALPDGKLYLSPILDCFDGLPVCWTIGENPDAELVNLMLDKAVSKLHEGEKPIIHTDRGSHYRWPGWIERMEKFGLTRSMSKKGCSPDNSACEGFFGTIKNEMFYNRDWQKVSKDEFKKILEEYLNWFCNERIKIGLGGMSPLDYRRKLNLPQ